jgi:RNA polymerase sigma-70 factor, ECF subfamily
MEAGAMTAALRLVPAETDDAALIERARGGDRGAFTLIFRRHVDRVHAHLTRLIGPCAERDDVLQDVFLRLHRSLPSYRGDCALPTYLHRMTVNAALDHLRSRKRQPSTDADELDGLVAPGLDGAARVRARGELVRLFEHLNHLSPKKRIAFVLVAVEGHSLAEAAELVGANEDAVKQRVLHARRELAERIERETRREESP